MVELSHIARRGGILALAALARTESLTMRELMAAAELSASPARELRLVFEAAGLLKSEEVPVRGLAEIRVSLTPWGREVARHIAAAGDALARGPPDKKRR